MARRGNFYERRVFPWLNDKLSGSQELTRIRAEALALASGRVLEIGFGSGPNLAHYPITVESIVAIEPNEGMNDRAASRIRTSRIPVTTLVGPAEMLPVPDRRISSIMSPRSEQTELLQGTLDMLIQRTLLFGPAHGRATVSVLIT